MRTIEIGLEVHKAIEAERRTLDEAEDEILVRLLKLTRVAATQGQRPEYPGVSWKKDGVVLPDGTLLHASYSGQELDGVVRGGQWIVGGRTFKSPSMALIHNVTTRAGKS